MCYDGNTKNKQMFVKVGENIAFLLYGMYNIGKETLWGKKMIYSGIWDFVQLNLDDDDQLLVQKMNEDDDAEETAELLKDLFPDFSYVKRKRKPKKD